MYRNIVAAVMLTSCAAVMSAGEENQHATTTWQFDKLETIGQYKPVVLGAPQALQVDGRRSIVFDGSDDALVFDTIPIAGWKQFTIEVLIRPDGSGFTAPRFMHFEDEATNRGTMEMRITNRQWYMDCFLKNGDPAKPNERLTLIDSTLLHPCDRWYWVAMTYDGNMMKSYINGQLELQGKVDIPSFDKGKISIGARLNKVNWFKGAISQINFHSMALSAKELQQLR